MLAALPSIPVWNMGGVEGQLTIRPFIMTDLKSIVTCREAGWAPELLVLRHKLSSPVLALTAEALPSENRVTPQQGLIETTLYSLCSLGSSGFVREK